MHPGPHVFNGQDFFPKLRAAFGENSRSIPDDNSAAAATVQAEAFPEMRPAWDREAAPAIAPSSERGEKFFRLAEKNARLANEALFRCRRYLDGWLAHADPATGLIPRNLRESDYWNGRDSAADNYPFMVLTASITDRPLMEGRLLDMLHTEIRLTSRLDRLPDDYSFSKKGWRREKLVLDEVIFDGAEYVKDGLIEGWHGDGNFARTSLMYALWKTQGVTVQPWRAGVRFGAVREGGAVFISVIADQPWEGRLIFDRPRHKLLMRLPLDYTRINQFPEWFTVQSNARYAVKMGPGRTLGRTGAQLAKGIPLKLKPGEMLQIEVSER